MVNKRSVSSSLIEANVDTWVLIIQMCPRLYVLGHRGFRIPVPCARPSTSRHLQAFEKLHHFEQTLYKAPRELNTLATALHMAFKTLVTRGNPILYPTYMDLQGGSCFIWLYGFKRIRPLQTYIGLEGELYLICYVHRFGACILFDLLLTYAWNVDPVMYPGYIGLEGGSYLIYHLHIFGRWILLYMLFT